MEHGKHCKECKEWKPFAEFYKCPSFTDGLQNRCRPCHIAFKASRPPRIQHPPVPADFQRCNKCARVKPFRDYHRDSRKPSGHQYQCKTCCAAKERDSYQRRKGLTRELPPYDPNTSKRCPSCLHVKPLPEFAKSPVGMAASWCKECVKTRRDEAASPETQAAKKLYEKAYRLRKVFNLTLKQYDEMLAAQGGVCAICKKPETRQHYGKPTRLAVDHDHDTGQVRGLLCRACNVSIGFLGHSTDTLRSAIIYLEASIPPPASDS